MPGELWRERVQIGKEVTQGLAVPATRVAYLQNVKLSRERDSRNWSFSTGSRDNRRAHTQGPVMAGGSVEFAVSPSEIIEFLLCSIKGAVTPTTPGGALNARLWTFTPGTSLDSMTIERNDGARIQRAVGVQGNSIEISGEVGGENRITVDLMGTDRQDDFAALTTALTERVPKFVEGWQTRIYLDALGGTPGTTEITDLLLSWTVTVDNQMERWFAAHNALEASGVNFGELDISAELKFRAAAAQALTELQNWDADTQRLLRLEFLDERAGSVIDAGTNEAQTITITGSPIGGTFTLSFTGTAAHPIAVQTTAAIPYNATAADVMAALKLLPGIRSTGISGATGGPLPGTPVVVTFAGALAGRNIVQMTATSSLTGGSSPAVAVTTSTPGVEAMRPYLIVDIPGAWESPDTDDDDASARAYSFPLTYLYDPTNAFGIRFLAQNDRATAF